MVFDQLAGFAEKHMKKLKAFGPKSNSLFELINQAALFHFPVTPHTDLPKESWPEKMWNDFHLPFRAVVCEDVSSAVLLFDLEENAIGLSQPRMFVDVISNQAPPGSFPTEPDRNEPFWASKTPLYMAAFGVIWEVAPDDSDPHDYHINGSMEMALVFNDKKEIIHLVTSEQDPDLQHTEGFRNPMTAIEELGMLMADTGNFILETSPKIPRKQKPDRILRSHDRPIYTVLRPKEIRDKLRIQAPEACGGPQTRTRRPGEVRAHWRAFRSERYIKARGKRRFFPSTWQGPSETTQGNKRYRVLLDR